MDSTSPLALDKIQQAITQLSVEDYKLLTKWLTDHDFERWDNQIIDDLNSGRLDTFIEEAKQEYRDGQTKPL